MQLGGIYALERLACDSPHDQATIVEVLTAFVRHRATVTPPTEAPDDEAEGPATIDTLQARLPTVQAAMRVLGRMPRPRHPRLELPNVDLRRAELPGATLTDADLWGAGLTRAFLPRANLTRAHLPRANLTDAKLMDANLNDADLAQLALLGQAVGLPAQPSVEIPE